MPDQTGMSNKFRPVHIPSPVDAYTSNNSKKRSSLAWEAPEWDLAEIGRIRDIESIINRAFIVKKDSFTKEGYGVTGKNIDRVRYIKKRLLQMEMATKTPFPMLISDTVDSLVSLQNAFWVKVRNRKASGGKVRVDQKGKEIEPVAGYFILPAETVRFKRDQTGKVVKYEQGVYGHDVIEFNPDDVVHFYFNKRPGFAVGTPDVISVKDDIRALRRIEENLELLLHQHLFPLFHYIVGTEDKPAGILPNGSDEIQEVQYAVNRMPADGCWVTSERHKIVPVAAPGAPVSVEKAIEHFKTRIYVGIGVSSIDMGEGQAASRSTAQTLSRNLIDHTKCRQREFGAQFYSYIIQELLAESMFPEDSLLDEENKVLLEFNEIDFESRQAKENHLVDIFTKNAITHDEMRQDIGRESFKGDGWPTSSEKKQMFVKGEGDFARTYYGLFDRDKIILVSTDEPGTEASVDASKARSKASNAENAPNAAVANKGQPENQHGKRPSTKTNKDEVRPSSGSFIKIYDRLRNDTINTIKLRGLNIKLFENACKIVISEASNQLIKEARQQYRSGIMSSGSMPYNTNLAYADGVISDHINRYVAKFYNNLIDRVDANTIKHQDARQTDSVLAEAVFSAMRYRITAIEDTETSRAYNYGFVVGHTIHEDRLVEIESDSKSCEICSHAVLRYKHQDVIIYEELPPLHPYCTCGFKVTKEK